MADGLHGDFAQLGMLIRQIEAFPEALKRETAELLSLELLAQVQRGFAEDRDPYGEAWEPLKHRSGEILRDNRILANSFTCPPEWPLRIVNNTPYANFHQEGTKKKLADGSETPIVPRRRMVPDAGELPALWATPLTQATELIVQALRDGMVA